MVLRLALEEGQLYSGAGACARLPLAPSQDARQAARSILWTSRLDCTQAKRNNSVYIPLGSYIISASQLKTPKRAIRVQVPSSASLSTKLPVVVPASGSSLCSLMLKPKALVPGNTIGIVAPASTVDPEAFVKGVAELQSGGYKVRYSDSIFARDRYFAGPHEERANELMRFFRDPTIDGIFCARGGYGCQHLLSHLDAATIQTNPKVFVGYSDVTVLSAVPGKPVRYGVLPRADGSPRIGVGRAVL